MLRVHGSDCYMNAPHCHVICILLTLLKCEMKQFHGQRLEMVPKVGESLHKKELSRKRGFHCSTFIQVNVFKTKCT